MIQKEFEVILTKVICNLDIMHLKELDIYSSKKNYFLIEKEIINLIKKVKSKRISKLKIYFHREENKFSVLTYDMIFISRYAIRKLKNNNFTITVCNNGIPF